MVQKGLTGFFEKFLTKESLFLNKKVLQQSYTPETIPHRENEIGQIANILAPVLKKEKPSNLFCYGKTGTGKTLSIKHTADKILEVARNNSIAVSIIYVNCKLKKVADTEYRLIAHLIRELGKEVPVTGLPTEELYKILFKLIDKNNQITILVLDEIDQLVKKAGDELLYNLTRINSELKNSQISLVGISNDLLFTDNLDPRVKSSLSEEELVFPPYNALQLQDILNQRAKEAFKPTKIGEGVIEKCAAYAAREHGDARRALELLRVAGEIAERKGFSAVAITHIDEAEEKIEKDKILETIYTQPKQFQLTLYSIITLYLKRKKSIYTGEVYDVYKGLCLQTSLRPLTQRRLSDIIAELDMLGIISTKTISQGRYGRTREILLATPKELEPKIKVMLETSLGL